MRVRDFEDHDVGPACRLTNHFIENTAVHFGTSPLSDEEFGATWRAGRGKYPWLAAEVDGGFSVLG